MRLVRSIRLEIKHRASKNPSIRDFLLLYTLGALGAPPVELFLKWLDHFRRNLEEANLIIPEEEGEL